jgi:serine phosphatase RsbU (regulator of sigma subunit)
MNAAGEVTLRMDLGNLPLGVLPDVEYESSEPHRLDSGDVVVLLTDGILEAVSPDGNAFDWKRTVQTVRVNRQRTAAEILESLVQAAREHTGRGHFKDDVTLVIIKAL